MTITTSLVFLSSVLSVISVADSGFPEQRDPVRVGAEPVVRDAPDIRGLGEALR